MKIINNPRWVVASLALLILTPNLAVPKLSSFMVTAQATEDEHASKTIQEKAAAAVDVVNAEMAKAAQALGVDVPGRGEEEDDEPTVDGKVEILTEENFERLTQAATGATTGDWFIKFYAPWCGHCRKLEPTWNDLARKLGGQVNIGKVDVTSNKSLGKRFDIKSFPTLLMFSHGKVYKFSGARKLDALMAYAKGDFKSDEPRVVPKPSGMAVGLKVMFENFKKDLAGIPKGKVPKPHSIALILIAVLSLVVLAAVALSQSSRPRGANSTRPKVE